MLEKVKEVVEKLDVGSIEYERKLELEEVVAYIQSKINADETVKLNFICTHNSRRSQFAQVWSEVAADFYDVPMTAFSGGVEVTACNERTIASLKRFGFEITSEGDENPRHVVNYDDSERNLVLYSKLYNDITNPADDFAAIMTCSDADDNCPFIPGADVRIPLRYEDPKSADDTPEEANRYDGCSLKIATEMLYIFSKVRVK